MNYIGKLDASQNDLQHWKYIRKYKNSKGNTVYVYANKKEHSLIKDAKKQYDYDQTWFGGGEIGSEITGTRKEYDDLLNKYMDKDYTNTMNEFNYRVVHLGKKFVKKLLGIKDSNNSASLTNRPNARKKRVSNKSGTVYKR